MIARQAGELYTGLTKRSAARGMGLGQAELRLHDLLEPLLWLRKVAVGLRSGIK